MVDVSSIQSSRVKHLGVVASLPQPDGPPLALARRTDSGRGDAQAGEDALDGLLALVRDDLEACNRAIVARMDSPVALIPQLAAHIVAAGRQAAAPVADPRLRPGICGYSGAPPRDPSCRLRRVHPHRDPAARRRGGREPAAARPRAAPTPCSATRRRCWSATSCSPAAFQLMVEDGSLEGARRSYRTPSATIAEGRGAATGDAERPVHVSEEQLSGRGAAARPPRCSPRPARSAPMVADRPVRRKSQALRRLRHATWALPSSW